MNSEKLGSPSSAASTDAYASKGIELNLRKLSLSVIPPPSLLTRVARKLHLASGPSRSQSTDDPGSDPVTLATLDNDEPRPAGGSASPTKSDRDLRNVGINIFRKVDLTVKPGQGMNTNWLKYASP